MSVCMRKFCRKTYQNNSDTHQRMNRISGFGRWGGIRGEQTFVRRIITAAQSQKGIQVDLWQASSLGILGANLTTVIWYILTARYDINYYMPLFSLQKLRRYIRGGAEDQKKPAKFLPCPRGLPPWPRKELGSSLIPGNISTTIVKSHPELGRIRIVLPTSFLRYPSQSQLFYGKQTRSVTDTVTAHTDARVSQR